MAYDPSGAWTPEDDSVSKQVKDLTDAGSPLIDSARTGAMKTANQRGLLNSSMAAGAGEQAVINSVTPIASQNASQIAQKNLNAQQFGEQTKLNTQQNDNAQTIAGMNISSNDREKTAAAVAAMNNSYTDAFKTIESNQNLPADARNATMAHLGELRDSDFNLIEQIYGVTLDWPSTGTPTVTA